MMVSVMKRNWMILAALLVGAVLGYALVQAQTRSRAKNGAIGLPGLTAQDYFEIRELANRYPYLIPTCDGEGYADMYADDGVFIDRWSNNGVKESGIRWQGREKLMEAAGSGPLECNKTGLVSYMATNHMIVVEPDGTVTGTVYTLAGGGDGNPDVMRKNDPYEDIYVKTPKGWRFKQRAHVRDKNRALSSYTEGVYPMNDPRGPAKGDRRQLKAR